MLEHGAYSLLLDRYYATEQPIPQTEVYRVTRARQPAERTAVDAVLAEFFTVDGAVYRNKRADAEIEKAQAQAEANRAVAREREARRIAQRNGNESRTNRQPIQTPDSISQSKNQEGAGAPTRSAGKPKPEFDPSTVAGLDAEAWVRWRDYRSKSGKPLKPVSFEAAAKQLAEFGADQGRVVEQSIAAGWQGLFALKGVNGKPSGSSEAQKAWERLLASGGAGRTERDQRAIEAVGGWSSIQLRTPYSEPKIKADFCHAYGA